MLWYTADKGRIMAKVPVNAKIETQMKAKLEIIGRKNSLSYADVVRMALCEYIGKFEKANGNSIRKKSIKSCCSATIRIDRATKY